MYRLEEKNGTMLYHDSVEQITLSVPQQHCIGLAKAPELEPLKDNKMYLQALRRPNYGPGLRELALQKKAKSACVLISDATRHVPTHLVSEHIVSELEQAGITGKNIRFIVALGVHRDATEAEMREAVGDALLDHVTVENHTPFDPGRMVYLGDTSCGTPVEVCRRAYECDLHIAVGKVEQHVFAGYSGGRKSVLPGISSDRSILANHSYGNLNHPCASPGVLEGNPIHLDMLEAARMFRLDFAVHFIMNDDYQICGLFTGEPEQSHLAAVELVRQHSEVVLTQRPDIIVTSPGYPGNIDLYQGIKPLPALMPILQKGMTLVLLCKAGEGVNSLDMLAPFQQAATLNQVRAYMQRRYTIQMDAALLLERALRKGIHILLCSPGVDDETARMLFMEPCKDVKELMKRAYASCGKQNPGVLFYPAAHKTIPVPKWE